MPQVPYARSRYSTPSNRISEIIQQGGQAQAEGHLRSGSVWSNVLQQLGQIPGQMIESRERSEERAARADDRKANADLRDAQTAKLKRDATNQEAVGGAMRGYGQEGFDIDAETAQLPPEARVAALKLHEELETSRLKTKELKDQAARRDAFDLARLAGTAESMIGTPLEGVGIGIITKYAGQHFPEQLAAISEAAQKDPASVKLLLKKIQEDSPEYLKMKAETGPQYGEAPPGTTVYDKRSGDTKFTTPAKPPDMSPEEQFIATKYGPNPTAEQRLSARGQYAAAGREPDQDTKTRIWVMRPNESGKLEPVRVRESEVLPGDKPANTREQGRAVTSGDANRLSDMDVSLNQVEALTLRASDTGAGSRLGAMTPDVVTEFTGVGAESKGKQAQIDLVKQIIGKALEGGVLRKEDEIKYAKILPKIGDPPEVTKSKLEGLKRTLREKRESMLAAYEDAGYDVTKFREREAKAGANKPKTAEEWLAGKK